ncbi:hypothetical protein D3C76_1314810 [compost metagenome]
MPSYNGVLVDTFIVGTNVPNGVPRPVVKITNWQPAAASAEEATRSLPGALRRFKPLLVISSPYLRTSITVAFPDF